MSKKKIAIQGELGAYSHIAVENLYKDAVIKTCATFEETFNQANKDPSYKILIPIENSLAGRVADIHYLLPKYKLQIHGEYFQPVEHNLLCKQEANIDDIKFVRSHAQAIGQCQNIINKRKFKVIISADTAGSAKELAEGNDKSIAAIASQLSAKIYKLKILEKNNEREDFFYPPIIECTSLVTEERRNLGNTKEEYLCIHIEERESARVWWDSAHLC